ncbi:lamin tail domain-containing protein [Streptomyces yerevanensis]|uniref:lamin tail domain-containing protein n=1 Tax=Streptomyces yerevanensis TaxID=66378 RepID=UPI000527D214|nr:lamin tail domain-containing protein [Streptomyces yerevanensis]
MSASLSVTARRLSLAVAAAGALVGATAVPASADHAPRPHRPHVEISNVQYDSPGYDDGSNHSLNREWVELTNTSRHAVNLDGWTLSDKDGHTYTFDGFWLAGHATVRVHTGTGRDSGSDVYQDRHGYVWDNRSDTATLSNDRGRVIDTDSWGDHNHRAGGHHDR